MVNLLKICAITLLACAAVRASVDGARKIALEDIETGVVSGVAAVAGDADGITKTLCAGTTFAGSKISVKTDTIFDIASVTKAVAVSTALAICADRGLVDLDAPFTKYLPEYSPKLDAAPTVRQLAMHVGGFAGKPYGRAKDGAEMLRQAARFAPPNPVGEKYEYACWNFILLGKIVENAARKSLKDFCKEEIFEPLGMADSSMGKPAASDETRLVRTLSTERAGQISDPHAFIIYRDGLCAGNAGMFSTAADLAKFCRMILNGGSLGGKKILGKSYSELITAKSDAPNARRSLGWDMAAESMPQGFSAASITHSGWSGQSVFIDIENKKFAVVLTVRSGDYKKAKADRIKIAQELLR